jgi:hypothetical protein
MRKLFPLGSVLLLCLMLTACVVDSKNPIGSPESAQIDQRLLGDWIATNGDIVHFSARDAHWMTVVTTPKTPDPDKKPEPSVFFVTTIGDESYLSMKSTDANSKPIYSLFHYRISSEQKLQMWGLSQDEMAAAVRAGKLKGTVQDRGTAGNPPHPDLDVHLTDTSERLAKFISHHDPAVLFTDESDPLTKIATNGD